MARRSTSQCKRLNKAWAKYYEVAVYVFLLFWCAWMFGGFVEVASFRRIFCLPLNPERNRVVFKRWHGDVSCRFQIVSFSKSFSLCAGYENASMWTEGQKAWFRTVFIWKRYNVNGASIPNVSTPPESPQATITLLSLNWNEGAFAAWA